MNEFERREEATMLRRLNTKSRALLAALENDPSPKSADAIRLCETLRAMLAVSAKILKEGSDEAV